jgi:hypothetical protein
MTWPRPDMECAPSFGRSAWFMAMRPLELVSDPRHMFGHAPSIPMP